MLDIYEFCSEALKKQLDAGRELERKEREVHDHKKIEENKAGQDVEMKDANEEVKETKKAVGQAAKAEAKLLALKKDDERLYRKHG